MEYMDPIGCSDVSYYNYLKEEVMLVYFLCIRMAQIELDNYFQKRLIMVPASFGGPLVFYVHCDS